MKIKLRTKLAVATAALLALSATAPRAQGGDEEEGFGSFYVEIGGWVSKASGIDFRPATVQDESDPFNVVVISADTGNEARMRYRGGYEIHGNVGGLIFTWFTHEERVMLGASQPGNYVYGELLAHPLAAGFENDGMADGFDFSGRTNLRDFRLDFYRTAFSSARVTGTWFVGYRRVKHKREQDVEYLALLNTLPPLIPPFSQPRPDLNPFPDTASMSSNYRGRGIEAGMDFVMPLYKDKISLETGFGIAILRGKVDAAYRSENAFYFDSLGGIPPPYDLIWMDPNLIADVEQGLLATGITAQSEPIDSHVVEANLGVRWKIWRDLDVFFGFRTTQYNNVGLEIRNKQVVDLAGFNVIDLQEEKRSVTYEGIYGGVSISF